MRADTRLGGHLVQGHVDATVAVIASGPTGRRTGSAWRCRRRWRSCFVSKGSVAVNGVSLTVATLEEARF